MYCCCCCPLASHLLPDRAQSVSTRPASSGGGSSLLPLLPLQLYDPFNPEARKAAFRAFMEGYGEETDCIYLLCKLPHV
jgi:hypothetical protein